MQTMPTGLRGSGRRGIQATSCPSALTIVTTQPRSQISLIESPSLVPKLTTRVLGFRTRYPLGLSSVTFAEPSPDGLSSQDSISAESQPSIVLLARDSVLATRIATKKAVTAGSSQDQNETSDPTDTPEAGSESATVPTLPALPKRGDDTERRGKMADGTIRVYPNFQMFMVPKRDAAILSRFGHHRIPELRYFEKHLAHLTTRLASEPDLGSSKQQRAKPRNIVVFKGGYPDICRYFKEKEWLVNPDHETNSDYSIRFSVKVADIDRSSILPWQYTNHFTHACILTTKSGLTKLLMESSLDIDPALFYPQCYRVVNISPGSKAGQLSLSGNNDDTLAFIEGYLDTECLRICHLWMTDPSVCASIQRIRAVPASAEPVTLVASANFKYSRVQLQLAYRHLLYRTASFLHYDIYPLPKKRFLVDPLTTDEIRVVLSRLPAQFPVPNFFERVTPQELSDSTASMTSPKLMTTSFSPNFIVRSTSMQETKHGSSITIESEAKPSLPSFIPACYTTSKTILEGQTATSMEYENMTDVVTAFLQHAPQGGLSAKCQGIYIGKPGAKSRGRGIFCSSDISRLLVLDPCGNDAYDLPDETSIDTADRYVVQKYIEAPLLIGGYKFDIRQWVFVGSINPLIIFQWTSPYLRFCSTRYSTEGSDVENPFMHLSNNSVQKHYSEFGKEDEILSDGNMWGWERFAQFLEDNVPADQDLHLLTEPSPFGYYVADKLTLRGPVPCTRTGTPEYYDPIDEPPYLPRVMRNVPVTAHAADYRRSRYLRRHVFETLGERLLYDMARIIITTIQAARFEITSDENNFELFGYDFLIDDQLQVWLLEINASPTLERSTSIVTPLIDQMSRGLVNIITDAALGTKLVTGSKVLMPKIKNAKAVLKNGLDDLEKWQLIYREKKRMASYSPNLVVTGKSKELPT
ncbi:Tubulin tyrosine ligase-like 6 [Giardia muris]|uniref:Tubulin tyrosine ligase-like 6 n=1 Tax=Giardia muris TaxID=5742 RepID=A0A4Z1ST43_GIAMU|nr:Tubulin tyrosine ligase-like 6 [Giardia muris]|eukprot:TNJ28175.1 Tubulin tyrosine ligase-like 6 [Giardia muris]